MSKLDSGVQHKKLETNCLEAQRNEKESQRKMRDNTSEEVKTESICRNARVETDRMKMKKGSSPLTKKEKGRQTKTQLKEKSAATKTQEAKKNLKTGVRSTKLTGNNQILNLDGKRRKVLA